MVECNNSHEKAYIPEQIEWLVLENYIGDTIISRLSGSDLLNRIIPTTHQLSLSAQ